MAPSSTTYGVTKSSINGFFGPNRVGSNFWICSGKLVYNSLESNNTESLYQAMKFLNHSERLLIAAMTPRDAKWAGRKVQLRDDWDRVNIPIMRELTHIKYQLPTERTWLLSTGDAYLEETNSWGDKFWGVCNGVGQNNLGIILMRERSIIRKEIESAKPS